MNLKHVESTENNLSDWMDLKNLRDLREQKQYDNTHIFSAEDSLDFPHNARKSQIDPHNASRLIR